MKKLFAQDNVYVVVTERDTSISGEGNSPIVLETYIHDSSLSSALNKTNRLNGLYGEVLICKLIPVGNIEEVEKILNLKD